MELIKFTKSTFLSDSKIKSERFKIIWSRDKFFDQSKFWSMYQKKVLIVGFGLNKNKKNKKNKIN